MPSPKKELLQKIASDKFIVAKKGDKFILKRTALVGLQKHLQDYENEVGQLKGAVDKVKGLLDASNAALFSLKAAEPGGKDEAGKENQRQFAMAMQKLNNAADALKVFQDGLKGLANSINNLAGLAGMEGISEEDLKGKIKVD